MRSSDFLFRLIKSLSKGDRRNLKLFGRLQDGDKKYLQLFDAIDAQEEYDEAQLLEQFKDERFTKQFSVAKNYLYNYILKTLHVFHRDDHSDLNVLLHQIEILMSKNLFDQAQKLVRKAKHLAERQERFQELLYLLDDERKILNRMERSREYEMFIDDIAEQERVAMQRLQNYLDYQHLTDEVYVLTKKGQAVKHAHDAEKLREIRANPLLQSEDCALSVRALIKMYDILIDCYWYDHDVANSLAYSGKMIAIYEAHKDIRIERNIHYIWTVSNFGIYSYYLGKKDQAFAALNKLRNIEVYNSEEIVRVFEKYYYFKIALCIELGDVETGLSVIKEFEAESKHLDGAIMKSVELGIYYVCAYFYLTTGMYESCIPWLNRILNEPRTELRTDLQCSARVLNLIAHYELGNLDILEYMMKSTTRFLSNRNRLLETDRLTMRCLRTLSNLGPDSAERDVFENFLKEMDTVLQDDFERKSLSLLNVQAWMQSKVTNQPMYAILKSDPSIDVKV